MKLVHDVREYNSYFVMKKAAIGVLNFSSIDSRCQIGIAYLMLHVSVSVPTLAWGET
jgi:hypothetical protein